MQALIGPGAEFPDPRFPLVKAGGAATNSVRLDQAVNILLIFIEGLDRRFLGRTYGDIPGTPFLDRLREESLYFEPMASHRSTLPLRHGFTISWRSIKRRMSCWIRTASGPGRNTATGCRLF